MVINPVDHPAVPGEVVHQRIIDERKHGALLVQPTWHQGVAATPS